MELTEQQIQEKLRKDHPELYRKNYVEKTKEISASPIGFKSIHRDRVLRRLKKDNIELYKKYEEEGLFEIDHDLPMTFTVTKHFLRRFGIVATERLGIQIYELYNITMFLKSKIKLLVGEDWIKQKYEQLGYNYEESMKKLDRLSIKLDQLKKVHDMIQDKSFKTKINKMGDIEKQINNVFKKRLSRIPLFIPELNDLFFILLDSTSIKRKEIPNDCLEIKERKGIDKVREIKPPISIVNKENR